MTDLSTILTLAGCAGVISYGIGMVLSAAVHGEHDATMKTFGGSLIIALAVGVALMVGTA